VENDKVPAFDEMMQTLIDVLKQRNGSIPLETLRKEVATYLKLSPSQATELHKPNTSSKQTRFEYNLAWTCSYLKNAGYINNTERGKWELTELGKETSILDVEQIKRKVRTYKSGKNGISVTIPDAQDEVENDEPNEATEVSMHTEIQWLLLKLGQDMGLEVWIAHNDKNKAFNGFRFSDQPKLLKKLPHRFDEATQKTVELIDVLWVKGQAIIAAFEIENSTAIYSGLLRLSDLTAMQPDLTTPLYIVAPDERQHKVISEINRPTFSKATNLAERCNYISYSALRRAITEARKFVAHLDPNFIKDYSERIIHPNQM
jgi:hypothetical protein